MPMKKDKRGQGAFGANCRRTVRRSRWRSSLEFLSELSELLPQIREIFAQRGDFLLQMRHTLAVGGSGRELRLGFWLWQGLLQCVLRQPLSHRLPF